MFKTEISLKFIVNLYFKDKIERILLAMLSCVRISQKAKLYFCEISRNLKVKFFMTLRERVQKSGKKFIF